MLSISHREYNRMADIYAKENSGGSEGCAVKHKKAELVGNKVNQMVSGREREDTGQRMWIDLLCNWPFPLARCSAMQADTRDCEH